MEKTITSNGYILVERCDACNAIIREETVENYTANKVNYFYGFNGKLDRIERINEQIYYADVNGEYNSIPMCRMIEYYGDDGTV